MADKMTLEQMKAVIQRGESVMYNGRVISRVEELPQLTELVESGNEEKQESLDDLKAKRAALDEQIAALEVVESPKAKGKGKEEAKK